MRMRKGFFVLRRIRTWLTASITTKRLSSLAIINIYRGNQSDYKRAVKIFLELHPRKLKVLNLIFDEEQMCFIFTYTENSNFCFTSSPTS